MTRISFSDKRGRLRICAEGHATGSEAACAAVSAIMYALAGWLLNENGEGAELEKSELRAGYAEIIFSGGEAARTAYEMAVIGLMQIAQAEPKRVSIVREGA